MKKRLSILLAFVIVLAIILGLPISVCAESLYIRKIVSVVYDDSGSMEGDKWAYANYAMQAFCGMLNSEDQLFVTYMKRTQQSSNYSPEKIDLSAKGIQASLDDIKKHVGSGSTPYEAVELAYDKLKSVNDSNPNTQYWLVVITDGAFDECGSMSNSQMKTFLNDNFKKYSEGVMPNGTKPQVTFLGIGGVASPDEDHNKGIYTYAASNAGDIVDAMSDMADRISGRTRLEKKDIKQIDDTTIQVSSSIPLLNIVVFSQGSQAKVKSAVYSNETSIPISRKASLSYPGYADLVGGAFLLGDSSTVIGSGTYNITFDQKVDLDDVIILFEPALEMKMTVMVNGQELSNHRDLDNAMEGDKISLSCEICEMGTNTKIDPSLLPPGTKFEITVSEGGKVVEQVSGKNMQLPEYVLKNSDTELRAAVTIEGFNPIAFSARFTPIKYIPKIDYSMTADYGSDAKSVKFDNIATNKDLSICFTVYADGVAITDPNALRALNPVITVSPQGNDGSIVYTNDGKIIFTPNSASMSTSSEGSYDVDVTCTLDNGTTATQTYTVLIATYQVIATDADQPVKKTEWYGNQVSVSFYITKDGVKLDKSAVEKHISVLLNEQHAALNTGVSVAPDGTITVTPFSDEQRSLTFWSWWGNWAYYFGLSGKDVTVTLNHAFGTAEGVIEVEEESLSYLLPYVYLPLAIEVFALVMFVIWIVLVVTKPRYLKSATLYVGDIRYNSESGTHIIRNFTPVKLKKFNKLKKGNGRLKFKKTADVVNANGVKIRADRGGRIVCEAPLPWYKGKIEVADTDLNHLKTPDAIADYVSKKHKLEVNEFATTDKIEGDFYRALAPANPKTGKYTVVNTVLKVENERKVISNGKIIFYIN